VRRRIFRDPNSTKRAYFYTSFSILYLSCPSSMRVHVYIFCQTYPRECAHVVGLVAGPELHKAGCVE
jgi:hypothetical protein